MCILVNLVYFVNNKEMKQQLLDSISMIKSLQGRSQLLHPEYIFCIANLTTGGRKTDRF
jgi:hypothetical protein